MERVDIVLEEARLDDRCRYREDIVEVPALEAMVSDGHILVRIAVLALDSPAVERVDGQAHVVAPVLRHHHHASPLGADGAHALRLEPVLPVRRAVCDAVLLEVRHPDDAPR